MSKNWKVGIMKNQKFFGNHFQLSEITQNRSTNCVSGNFNLNFSSL